MNSTDNPVMGGVEDALVQEEQTKTVGAAPMAGKVIGGAGLMFAQSILLKGLGMAGQLILGKYLSFNDLGLIGKTQSAASFLSIASQTGCSEFLITRHRRFSAWAGPVFWFSLTMGAISLFLLAGGSFVIAPLMKMRSEGRFGGGGQILLVMMGISVFVDSLSVVATSASQVRLMFRLIAILTTVLGVIRLLLSVSLAVAGAGAWGQILTMLVMSTGACLAYWFCVRPQVDLRPSTRKWGVLLRQNRWLWGTRMCQIVSTSGDYLALSFFVPSEDVGVFFWACSMSVQAASLVLPSLMSALYPVLAQISDDPARFRAAFERALCAIGIALFPLTLLQAAMIRPVLHLIYHGKWDPAVPLVQAFSVAAVCHAMTAPCDGVLVSLGLFRTRFLMALLTAALFSALVWPLTALFGMWGALLADILLYTGIQMLYCVLVARLGYLSWPAFYRIFKLLGLAVLGTAVSLGAAHFSDAGDWAQAGTILVVYLIAYGAGVWLMARRDSALQSVIQDLLKRIPYGRFFQSKSLKGVE